MKYAIVLFIFLSGCMTIDDVKKCHEKCYPNAFDRQATNDYWVFTADKSKCVCSSLKELK